MRKILLLSLLVITALVSGCIWQPPTTTTISQTTIPITTTIKTTTIIVTTTPFTTTIPQTLKINIKNFAFNPSTVSIKAGTTITWTNDDSAPHTIKSDSFNSGNLNKGQSFQFRFDNPGTYDYICGIHPAMEGKVIVE